MICASSGAHRSPLITDFVIIFITLNSVVADRGIACAVCGALTLCDRSNMSALHKKASSYHPILDPIFLPPPDFQKGVLLQNRVENQVENRMGDPILDPNSPPQKPCIASNGV